MLWFFFVTTKVMKLFFLSVQRMLYWKNIHSGNFFSYLISVPFCCWWWRFLPSAPLSVWENLSPVHTRCEVKDARSWTLPQYRCLLLSIEICCPCCQNMWTPPKGSWSRCPKPTKWHLIPKKIWFNLSNSICTPKN